MSSEEFEAVHGLPFPRNKAEREAGIEIYFSRISFSADYERRQIEVEKAIAYQKATQYLIH